MLKVLESCFRQTKTPAFLRTFSANPYMASVSQTEMFARPRVLVNAHPQSVMAEIIKRHGVFVDNTDWLYRLLLSEQKALIFSAPKQIGKWTSLLLIRDLVKENAESLFEGTKIWDSDFFQTHWTFKEREKLACLMFDFSYLPEDDPGALERSLIADIERCATHLNLGLEVPCNIGVAGAMSRLLLQLKMQKKKVILLVNEVDKIFTCPNQRYEVENARVLDQFFACSSTLHRPWLRLVVGSSDKCFTIGDSVNTSLNITGHPILHPKLGFTEGEVREIFTESVLSSMGIDPNKKETFCAGLKKWYGRFELSIDSLGEQVYQPFSVLSCKEKSGQFQRYWAGIYRMIELKPLVLKFPHLIDEQTRIRIKEDRATLVTASPSNDFSTPERPQYQVQASDIEPLPLTLPESTALNALWRHGLFSLESRTSSVDFVLRPTNEETIQLYREMVFYQVLLPFEDLTTFARCVEHAQFCQFTEMKECLRLLLGPGKKLWRESEFVSYLERGFRDGAAESIKQYHLDGDDIQLVLDFSDVSYLFELKFNRSLDYAFKERKEMKCEKYCKERKIQPWKRIVSVELCYRYGNVAYIRMEEFKRGSDGKGNFFISTS